MTRKILLGIIMITMIIGTAMADTPIKFSQTPDKAQKTVKKYYKQERVLLVTRDIDDGRVTYEIKMANGDELEFDRLGMLTKIECKSQSVPLELIPEPIVRQVNEKFPNHGIHKYEVRRMGYKVEVTNGPDLRFNKKFVLVEVDD